MRIIVLDRDRKPLDPCHPARARQLLRSGRAAVFRCYPFTIILKDRTLEKSVVHPHRVKVDSGSKITGIAPVREDINQVVWAAEVEHRGVDKTLMSLGTVNGHLDGTSQIRHPETPESRNFRG